MPDQERKGEKSGLVNQTDGGPRKKRRGQIEFNAEEEGKMFQGIGRRDIHFWEGTDSVRELDGTAGRGGRIAAQR